MSTQREVFQGKTGTQRAKRASFGRGVRGPPEIFKNLYFKWCHLSYSWAIFVNLIRLYLIYTIICLKSVGVRKLQVAILARSPREMSQTDRIVWKHILSRVHVSVQPRICFIRGKNPNLSLIQSRPHVVYFNGSPTGHCLASVESGTDTATVGGVRVRECERACTMCLQYTIMIFYPGW